MIIENNEDLKNDIAKFTKSKINTIKSVDQIRVCDFHVSKYEEIFDLEKSYQKLRRLKMILQITINLFNIHQLYEEFNIKFLTEDNTLASYYRMDEPWISQSFKSPSHGDVEEALFNYILCFTSIQRKVNDAQVTKDSKTAQEVMVECPYCDEINPSGINKCVMCEMTLNENECNEPLIKPIQIEIEGHMNLNNVTKAGTNEFNNKTKGDLNYNKDNHNKWSCGGCEYLNEYTFINCEVCEGMIKDGKWSCGECTEENSCRSYHCHNCNNINKKVKENNASTYEQKTRANKVTCKTCGSLKENNDEDCDLCLKKNKKDDMNIGKYQWKCGKCGLLQSFDFIECSACGQSRGINGVWKCDKCSMINKCDNVRCGACEGENDYLKKEYCEHCKKNKVRVNEDKCRECRENDYNMKVMVDEDKINKKRDIVCENCKLSKDGYMKDCAVCKTLNEDNVKIGKDQWKCCKCGLLQSFDFMECSACGKSRGVSGLWKCDKCTLVNECLNNICKTCEFLNNHLKVKQSDVMKNNIKNSLKTSNKVKADNGNHLGKWLCQNFNCKQWSTMDLEYCNGCKLFKDFSPFSGDEVKQMKKGVVTSIWICYDCKKFNELKNDKCSTKKCDNTRFNRK